MSRFIRGEKGFTLLEIMVSLAILALALVTIMELFSGALRSAKISYDYSLAVKGAKGKMEDALNVNTLEEFNELQKGGNFEDPVMENYHWEIEGPDPYEVPEGLRADIEEVSGGELLEDLSAKLYQVSVRVVWASGLNEKDVKFTTIKMLEEED